MSAIRYMLSQFRTTWEALAEEGACDTFGSAECLRVFWEWAWSERWYPLDTFIRERANLPPGPQPEPEQIVVIPERHTRA